MKNWTRRKIREGWEKLRPQDHHSEREKKIRKIVIGVLGFFAFLACMFFLYVIFLLFTLPNPRDLADMNLTESTLIMDREGNVLYAVHGGENREALDSLSDISPLLVQATIAIEDDQFYSHIGIDLPAITRALLSEVGIGKPRGGSTITQQFVKNTFLSAERTYSRKLKEILLSLMVELRFKKDDVMLMYLNAIPYGSNAYGAQLAAQRYFGKDAKDLTLGESAILASIPRAPTRYSPYGNYRTSVLNFELTEESLNGRKISGENDLEIEEWTRGLLGKTFEMPSGEKFYLKGRSDLVLDRMLYLEMISEDDYDKALAEVAAIEFTPYRETIAAPHFVLWVKQLLEEKYGAAVVEQGGLKVYTSIDPDYQKSAEVAVSSKKDLNTEKYGAGNAALVSVDPQTGQILALVGSADYFDDEIDGQVNMITSLRQPGSSFKPFVYALAFLNRYSPATVVYDVPTSFGPDKPKNYDGSFHGPMSMRRALAQSRNIPAAKAYFMAGEQQAIIPFVKPFGFDYIQETGDYGWPLALGSAEVTPMEMAEAYSVFANNGIHTELTPFLRIENADGEILEEWKDEDMEKKEVLDPQVAFLVNDILSDASVGLGPNIRVDSIDNAAKTGTSTNEEGKPTNGWSVNYTPNLVTVTWIGNADSSAMNMNGDGYNTAAPIWKSYIMGILDKLESSPWIRPEGIRDVAISKASGLLPGKDTPSDDIGSEIFASFAVPTETDHSYKRLKVESISGKLATEYSPLDVVEEINFRIYEDPMKDRWPSWQAAIDAWMGGQDGKTGAPPTEYASDIHNAETASKIPQIIVKSPNDLSGIDVEESLIEVDVEILDEGNGVREVKFLLNDNQQYRETSAPYSGIIRMPSTAKAGDVLTIKVIVSDQYGYSSSSTINVKLEESEDVDRDDE